MKTTLKLFLFLLFCLPSWQSIHAQAAMPKPNWDRALAVESARRVNGGPVLKNLYQLARTGKNRQLLDSLTALEQNRNWSVPAREYVIWTFTIGLSDMEANTVNLEVLEYLSAYEPRTLVSHDDRSDVGVALFNISAAAAGVQTCGVARLLQTGLNSCFNLIPGAGSKPTWVQTKLSEGVLLMPLILLRENNFPRWRILLLSACP